MPKKTNIQKVAEALGVDAERASDSSAAWVSLENDKYIICIAFEPDGNDLIDITVSEKVYQVVDEKMIAKFKPHISTK
jgi:hypothetical protein